MSKTMKLSHQEKEKRSTRKSISVGSTSRPRVSFVHPILHLQQKIGDQAVLRLLKSGALQTKLKINQPGDIFEQEADRVTDEVMNISEHNIQPQPEREGEKREDEDLIQQKPFADQIPPLIQGQVEEEVGAEDTLQVNKVSDHFSQVKPDLESRVQGLVGGGEPLSESLRNYFEPRFGYDFSKVRLHRDMQARELSQMLGAQAFTLGRDIVFGAEQYSPETTAGSKLLAHELVHVVQQEGQAKKYAHKCTSLSNSSNYQRVIQKYPDCDQEGIIFIRVTRGGSPLAGVRVTLQEVYGYGESACISYSQSRATTCTTPGRGVRATSCSGPQISGTTDSNGVYMIHFFYDSSNNPLSGSCAIEVQHGRARVSPPPIPIRPSVDIQELVRDWATPFRIPTPSPDAYSAGAVANITL